MTNMVSFHHQYLASTQERHGIPWLWRRRSRLGGYANQSVFFSGVAKVARWWFDIFFIFHPDPWGNDPILTNIFQRGWNHQLGCVQLAQKRIENGSSLGPGDLRVGFCPNCPFEKREFKFIQSCIAFPNPSSSSSLYIWNSQASQYIM